MSSAKEDILVTEEEIGNRERCSRWTVNYMKKRIPILDWLPKYQWKENFISDLLCGFTLACIHVPQALAFSMLANVDLIFGLYTTCFTGIAYTLLGTAHISSFGPVAVGSMITGEAVSMASSYGYERSEIATSLTFLIGIVYLIGFVFQLGIFTRLFRKNFISPFIFGCIVHILTKSLKLLVGIKVKNEYGLFNFPKNVYNLFTRLHLTNYWALGTSCVILFIFVVNIVALKPLMKRCTKVVLPVEAVTMLLAALVSYLWNFEDKGVPVVGYVPSGFPEPSLPNWETFPFLISPAVTTAIINFSSSFSVSLLFNPNVGADQEMFAMAATNLLCANLQCITIGNSMTRTRVGVTLGLKTLMSTLVSSVLMLVVILFAGPIFSPMPIAVLGCFLVLSTTLLVIDRVREIIPLCRKSWDNSFMYVVILGTTLFLDVMYGLLVGVILSLRLILREVPEQKPKKESEAPETELLLNEKNGKSIQVAPSSQSKLNV